LHDDDKRNHRAATPKSAELLRRFHATLLLIIIQLGELFPRVHLFARVSRQWRKAVSNIRVLVIEPTVTSRAAIQGALQRYFVAMNPSPITELVLNSAPLDKFDLGQVLLLSGINLRSIKVVSPGSALSFHSIASSTKACSFPNLESLHLEDVVINDLGVIVAAAPSLRTLTIRQCAHFNDADLEQVEAALSESIQLAHRVPSGKAASGHFVVDSDCVLTAEAAEDVATAVATTAAAQRPRRSWIKSLTVSRCAEVSDMALLKVKALFTSGIKALCEQWEFCFCGLLILSCLIMLFSNYFCQFLFI
jgi:hypothetical protein